jgi:iron complex transport system substrate-binding protein
VVGAENVATPTLGSRGVADVSLEQVLAWRPDIIIVLDPGFYKSVWGDPQWGQLAAVRNKKVYLAPSLPFGWVDEPPAANRLIGLRWLAHILYPSLFPEDIRAETKQFDALFYQQTPSDRQLDQLLGGDSAPP